MNEIFKIFKIGVTESERISQQDNDPHHHDFEELLIGKYGQLEHFIDFKSQVMNAPFVSFITQGKVHRAKPLAKNKQCDIWGIRFKSEFIADTVFQLYTTYHDKANICLKADECFERLNTICEIIYQEYLQPDPDLSVIRQLLSSLFTIIESERKKLNLNNDESKKIKSTTFKNFLILLNEHYKEAKDVNFYAEQLSMTIRNLNLICQEILHQSVSEIIETRKLTEAKNLLITTHKTIAEIGYELGFNEKTYFTHAFKKKSGLTPSEYRKEMAKIIS
ncbi:AraC family transcriptional regulator [Chryseobacterium sp. T16E-39]|uniref:helix-turn-helix transcriptional regulator n=1 Tax=Chryseobacterium sp. T16E-39 TaxID=2015076 RepID=UPI000B5B0FA2|nr:helix-turn-helix transcriptional regulator [Chryseobacterium sp. T16E-39]ASK28898.1 AraC family transcriptional regulator [Chryseobacterium sp. T16E-39]